jgi:hypothetical protein
MAATVWASGAGALAQADRMRTEATSSFFMVEIP